MGEKVTAVLTSGGDAPGMNAAVRAVARVGLSYGMRVIGIHRGYNGLLHGDMFEMNLRSVSDVIHRGGTILYTARSPEFKTDEGVKRAAKTCKDVGKSRQFQKKQKESSIPYKIFHKNLVDRLKNPKYFDKYYKEFFNKFKQLENQTYPDISIKEQTLMNFLIDFDKEFQKKYPPKKGRPYSTQKYWSYKADTL